MLTGNNSLEQIDKFAQEMVDYVWYNKPFVKIHESAEIISPNTACRLLYKNQDSTKEQQIEKENNANTGVNTTLKIQLTNTSYNCDTTEAPSMVTKEVPQLKGDTKQTDRKVIRHDASDKAIDPKENIYIDPEVKVRRRKREYYKKRILTGNLVINTPNCFLGQRKGRIIVKLQKQIIKEIAAEKIDHITIDARAVVLSSNVIMLCVNKGIPIDFFNFKGEPIAKIYMTQMPDAKISIAQTQAFFNGKCYDLASSFVEGKICNQINVIKYFLKYRKKIDSEFTALCIKIIKEMSNFEHKLKHLERVKDFDLFRNRLMAIEGAVSSKYWEVVSTLLENDVLFVKRERQRARDIVNSCLNYAYSIMYSRIWQILIQQGLNPMISYLHKEQHNKPTLCYDLMEEFRQMVVDRTIFSIFTKGREIKLTDEGISLESRKLIIQEIIERLKGDITFRGTKMNYEQIMAHQARAMIDFLTDKKVKYRPFIGKY